MFAEPEIARRISVNQYDRFLNWKIDKLPVPPKQAMQMVSNMHIIPANPKIAQEIKKVKRGDLVRLHGELVEVKDKDLVWTSSLTPTDLGEGLVNYFGQTRFNGSRKSVKFKVITKLNKGSLIRQHIPDFRIMQPGICFRVSEV